mgnify:CR=1 FL=1
MAFVDSQPKQFIINYIRSYIKEIIGAYSDDYDNESSEPNSTTTSCVDGMFERIFLCLRLGGLEMEGTKNEKIYIKIAKISAIGPGSDISGLQLLIDQNAKIQFTANDKSIQNNDIMVDYALKLTEQLQNTISNQQAAKLASESKATQDNGFLSLALGNEVSSDVNNQLTQINKNTNITKLFNQITNTIQQNSSTLNFKECILSQLQTGSIEIGEITAQDGGKITNLTIGIKQAMEIIQNCVFDTLQSSNITTQIAQDMGFTITNDTKNNTN